MNLIESSKVPYKGEEEVEKSISLWKDRLLEEDENIKVLNHPIYFIDLSFLLKF